MDPIRSDHVRRVGVNPWEGLEEQLAQQDVSHVLSDTGSLDSYATRAEYANICGCFGPAGGYCAVCSKVVCQRCFGFCMKCYMPLCPRHSVIETHTRGIRRLCNGCKGATKRRQLWRRVFSFLVEFDNEERI